VFGQSLYAQGYCSLSVTVVDPNDRPAEAKVVVQENDGRIIAKMANGGTAKFCDLGTKPVTVSVGGPECHQSVLKSVGLRWGSTTQVKIIYDEKPCLIDEPPIAACRILFRFADAEQHWLGGVVVKMQRPFDEMIRADEYGRVLVRIAAFNELLATATISGYDSVDLRIPCTNEKQGLERRITMTRTASK
jgi:hypothetical protein